MKICRMGCLQKWPSGNTTDRYLLCHLTLFCLVVRKHRCLKRCIYIFAYISNLILVFLWLLKTGDFSLGSHNNQYELLTKVSGNPCDNHNPTSIVEKKCLYNFFFISLYKWRPKTLNWFMNHSLGILPIGVKFALHLVHFMTNFELQPQEATRFFQLFLTSAC